MLISPDRYADVAYNGVDAQQHADGAVRMPEPVVRPCLYSNKYIHAGHNIHKTLIDHLRVYATENMCLVDFHKTRPVHIVIKWAGEYQK
jgi:hypothetical protein